MPPSATGSSDAIDERGIDYVGQEVVRLSTMPVWEQGRITPRPFVLRVFAAATPDGWAIMPGGFCRIAEQPDARAVSMGDGARSADVWVVSDKPVSTATLLPAERQGAHPPHRRRAAEPRRRQSVLARPLSRTRRGDAAAGAGAGLAAAGSRKGTAAALQSAERIQRLLVTWGAISQTSRDAARRIVAEALQSRSVSARHCRWCARRSAPRPPCASGCRPTPGKSSPRWRSGSPSEVEDDDGVAERGRTDLAGARELRRPCAGEHEPRRRLALPRYRPPHRARHQHHAFRPPVRL